MKIVILNTSERTGGAAVAAGRLGKALGQAGIQVDKLIRENTWLNRFRFYWERLIIFLCNHLNRKNLFGGFYRQYRNGFIRTSFGKRR